MKKIISYFLIITAAFFITSCSSTKNATGLKASTGNLDGTWTVSNISVDVPSTFKITDVFDEGPYQSFQGSTWNLVRNGKGSFTLTNGTKEDIYWSINGKGDAAQFQFKKLNGAKAKNVDDGYRLELQNISSNSFVARSPIDLGNGNTGYISYTFTK
ncbi:MAG: hypothetical protein M3015_09130 [Bacteroidota bacterium]|nr:hypothetical protein [Bacteroidota bacterium]